MRPVTYMRSEAELTPGGTVDTSPLLGTWVNTNPETDYIVKFVAAQQNGTFMVQAYGAHAPESIAWGTTQATPCAIGRSSEIAGFSACYDFGSAETLLAAYGANGVLVIQTYTTFKDDSGRPNIFSREFFHR